MLFIEIEEGDLIKLGQSRLLCADATKKNNIKTLIQNEKIQMLFTDPPFDFKEFTFFRDVMANINENFIMCSDKYAVDLCYHNKDIFRFFFTIKLKRGYMISSKTPIISHDLICYFRKGKSNFINRRDGFSTCFEENKHFAGRNVSKEHQKSLVLTGKFISHYTLKGQKVLDLFGGTGTTLIACQQLGRKCYMMELEPKRCEVIINRWEKLTGEKAEKIQ